MRDIKFLKTADELIAVKKKIVELQQQERVLKRKLAAVVNEEEPLELPAATIYQYSQKQFKSFKRKEVLAFLAERFGAAVALATDLHCTHKKKAGKRLQVKCYDERRDLNAL